MKNKEHPILFSTEMVKAILSGRKTQTRRIVKESNSSCTTPLKELDFNDVVLDGKWIEPKGAAKYLKVYKPGDQTRHRVFCKYEVGDLLYVRETWQWDWVNMWGWLSHPERADKFYFHKAGYMGELASGEKWKPSIHMPKAAARIWLEVTDIRVERAFNISEEDAVADGFINRDEFLKYLFNLIGREENVWLWAISYEVLSTTGRPIREQEAHGETIN